MSGNYIIHDHSPSQAMINWEKDDKIISLDVERSRNFFSWKTIKILSMYMWLLTVLGMAYYFYKQSNNDKKTFKKFQMSAQSNLSQEYNAAYFIDGKKEWELIEKWKVKITIMSNGDYRIRWRLPQNTRIIIKLKEWSFIYSFSSQSENDKQTNKTIDIDTIVPNNAINQFNI